MISDMVNLVSWIESQQTNMDMNIKTEYLRQQLQEQTALVSNWSDVKPIRNYYKPIKSCCESISRTNCCNCGARLKGWVCEYCGTINS